MLQNKFFFFVILIAALFIFQLNADACSCREKPTVLEEFKNSNLVVSGKITALDEIEKDALDVQKDDPEDVDSEKDSYSNYKSVRFVVEKVYKGNVQIGKELILGQGDGVSCASTFDKTDLGEKMLLYLDEPSGYEADADEEVKKNASRTFFVTFCGRSKGTEQALDDLLYLEKLDKVRGKTRISGTFGSFYRDAPSFANTQIKIIGKNRTYTARTDKNGVFEIYDLPAGLYSIEPNVPFGWRIDEIFSRFLQASSEDLAKNRVFIVLEEKGHAAADINFRINNAIRGRVISPVGKPMPRVRVNAISVSDDSGGGLDYTNDAGEFEISPVSPGNYNIVVNWQGKIDADQPFGRFFYPGVADRKLAAVVSMDAGKFLSGINIQIPKTIELIEISGRFLYADETPVPDESIEFNPNESGVYDKIEVKTDHQGRFSIKIPKGAVGKLSGEKYFFESLIKNCPKIREIVEANDINRVNSNEIEINGTENISDIKLTFPFSFCTTKEN